MRNLFLAFALLMFGSAVFAQQQSSEKAPVNDSIPAQDTVSVLSESDMQAAEKLYNEGVELYTKGEFRKALHSFGEAVKIKPNFPKAYYNAALCFIELKNPDSALVNLNNVILLDEYDKAYYLRGTVWVDLNELSDAKADFEQAVAIDSSTVRGES
jgi:tetratricopeptide (TPR) repeat protein